MIPNLAGVDRTLVAFFAGHQIDPLDYEKLRDAEKYGLMGKIQEKWSKALPYLNLWSQASDLTTIPTKVADLEDRLNKSNLKILQTEEKVNLLVGFLTSQNIKGTDSATQEFLDRIRKQLNTFTS